MKILFFGDIIGRSGRDGLTHVLDRLRAAHRADFVIVNAENAAHGKGLTPRIAQTLWDIGVDVLTMGNHTYDRKDIMSIIDDPRLIRPANYPAGVLGHGSGVFKSRSGISIGVLQVMGRVHMPILLDCPFKAADKELERLKEKAQVIIADVHTEATSETAALGWYLDGRVSAVVGTHTHVQTADERILPKGTAFLTDAGACGPINSIIGMEVPAALSRFLTGVNAHYTVASGDARVCGCVVDIDERTGHARSIQRISEIVALPNAQAEDK